LLDFNHTQKGESELMEPVIVFRSSGVQAL